MKKASFPSRLAVLFGVLLNFGCLAADSMVATYSADQAMMHAFL